MSEPLNHVSTILTGHLKDLGGGFLVRRCLPAAQRRSVGPFVFFDHFGPVVEQPGNAHDVRPHPHIGLATVTYLFEGAMMHRDSLGVVQRIEPGAINWMTAGRGVVHSERKPQDLLDQRYTVHGLQLWVALPAAAEEAEPAFAHTPADAIPALMLPGASLRVLVGRAFGVASPVITSSPTLYLDVQLESGSGIDLPADIEELAVYSVDGTLDVDGVTVAPQTMAVLESGTAVRVQAAASSIGLGARFVVVGGAALDGPRFMWWNFVASRKERIEQAKADWAAQRIGTVPGETEWIPLP